MKGCRIHRVYLASPASLALGLPVVKVIKVSARSASRPTSDDLAVRLPAIAAPVPGAVWACLSWLASLGWSDVLACLVGGDLVDLVDFLLADWPTAKQ